LKEWLNSDQLNNNQRRYVLDCLKIIGAPEAMEAIENADKSEWSKENRSYAEDIIAEAAAEIELVIEKAEPQKLFSGPSFRNPFEDNVEYIRIPGGTYEFSVPGKFLFFKFKRKVTVPALYFCKYPVTNKRYRRFISYLEGKEKEFQRQLPLEVFREKLLEYANTTAGYRDYLGPGPAEWGNKLRSDFDENKDFNGDDQPVVGVTWYAARAYCFWLSCLEAVINRGDKLENGDVNRVASIYRLPVEIEWEWAAGGNSDGSVREYPWPEDKGGPNPTLANYGRNVDATTPMGRYPDGATPLGLMDMAGNVWEWMENWYDYRKRSIALRGGSWHVRSGLLRCVSRGGVIPHIDWSGYVGFRVAALSSPSHTD
jgi:formylglycine-generating enzyme required for sulfatase activity